MNTTLLVVVILAQAILLSTVSATTLAPTVHAVNPLAGQGCAANMVFTHNINSQGNYCGNPRATATGPPIPSCTADKPGTDCRP